MHSIERIEQEREARLQEWRDQAIQHFVAVSNNNKQDTNEQEFKEPVFVNDKSDDNEEDGESFGYPFFAEDAESVGTFRAVDTIINNNLGGKQPALGCFNPTLLTPTQ